METFASVSLGCQILAVGPDDKALDELVGRLSSRGYAVERVASGKDCSKRFSVEGADLIIACLPFPNGGGADLVRELRQIDARVPIVIVGRDHQIGSASEAFRESAFEYVEDLHQGRDDILGAVGVALGARRGDAQLRYLREREATASSWSSLVGQSREMMEVVGQLRRVSERTTRGAPPTILLLGETGTGKGLVAKCIHYNGVRRNQAFVELNCAAIPASLLESELFGHERGAFTDAKTSRAGLFETAHKGTLFLDEIGALPLDLQSKLLTAIEEKRVRRLGARHSVQVDVQIIAATHPGLLERVRAQTFRADLYHRLNVVSVTIPPLRKRGEDIIILAESFLSAMCREYGTPALRLSENAKAYIREYHWPGNVRELKNQIERVVLLANDEIIDSDQFDRPSLPPPSVRPNAPPAGASVAGPSPSSSVMQFEEGLGLEEVERELIRRALERSSGNVSMAARSLKVSRQTLMYRIKKHAL